MSSISYECAECEYAFKYLFKDDEKAFYPLYVLAYCPECKEFCAALESEIEKREAECSVCGESLEACDGEKWVRFEDDGWFYKCPKCGEFAVEE
jgi:Zn finger protein HypA/HybF involved in hydrogenase expression